MFLPISLLFTLILIFIKKSWNFIKICHEGLILSQAENWNKVVCMLRKWEDKHVNYIAPLIYFPLFTHVEKTERPGSHFICFFSFVSFWSVNFRLRVFLWIKKMITKTSAMISKQYYKNWTTSAVTRHYLFYM